MPKTLLQVIQNMVIGGAQRSASGLMDLPDVETSLVTYEQLSTVCHKHYSGILLHVWCSRRNEEEINWPQQIKCTTDKLIIFNHDWHGTLDVGAKSYIVYSRFAGENSIADGEKFIVPGGIELKGYQQRNISLSDRPCVVGRLSTLLDGKISANTIDFWRRLPAARFIVGGDGPQRGELISAFSDDSRFEFPGAIRPSDVSDFMSSLDIFLYDTNWHVESFCYVVLEAMAAGCVVVAKEKGAIPEIISHGVNGFLYTSDDQAVHLCEELISNIDLRFEVGVRAREFASHYSLDRFRTSVVAVFGW